MDDSVTSTHIYPGLRLQQTGSDERSGENENSADFGSADEDLFFDWDAFYTPQNVVSDRVEKDWLSTLAPNVAVPSESTTLSAGVNECAIQFYPQTLPVGEAANPLPISPGYTNVAQWLDGAYRPPSPCSHCRKYRLQCLILRTTPANPNPVSACSSCVALFRTCSLAQGEKRQASGFETTLPVLGHLHGVTEQIDDAVEFTSKDHTQLSYNDVHKESKQFVRKGARVLRDWFHQHQDCPYPSEADKARLAHDTGFSRQRISTWFANARRRQKQKQQPVPSLQLYRAGSPMPINRVAMTPMERWQTSPPDEEPVPEAVIQDAIASTSTRADSFVFQTGGGSHVSDLSSGVEDASLASSISSFGSIASEGLSDSASSAWSHHSGDGPLNFPISHRRHPTRLRRGRRRQLMEESQYECTFCLKSFRKKHDWSRHEKSVHLPPDVWVCTPDLNQIAPTDVPLLECRFCESPFPSQAHWESHDFGECSGKPILDRSFNRKDYLWQHLRKFHGCTKPPVPDLDAWRSSQGDIPSRCGFCGSSLSTWSIRADHIASHFKEGLRMSQWTGDWGFNSLALSNLRNAILPSERALINEPSG